MPAPSPRSWFVLALLVVLHVLPSRALAQTFPALPFDAWVSADDLTVVPTREKLWPGLGILRYGDRVRVVGCVPDCAAPDAWADLEPFGAIRLSALRPAPRPAAAAAVGPDATFRYARVVGRGVVGRVEPNDTAAIVQRFDTGDEIVLAPDQSGVVEGFVQRPDGSYLRASDVRVFTPSEFSGWVDPPARFVFAHKPTTLTLADGTTRPVAMYERFAYLGQGRGVIQVEGGTLRYQDVRTGRTRRRPPRVPAAARWVHVDLAQQVLTAYQGDQLVFATLISAGKHQGTTQTGHFRVVRKLVHTTMKASASPDDSYFVEGVGNVQYFHGGVAFHMAYWHDRFGTPMSHGCVNLSPSDSRWLFAWSPGAVPDGWRGINPIAARMDSLYVRIERAPR